MKLLHYLEITNFKGFSDTQKIELDHPSVLIGPNNCGKTTAIQAIALWSQAVKAWHQKKANSSPKTRPAVALNRADIVASPILRTQYFWHNAAVRKSTQNIPITITIGLQHNNTVEPVTMDLHNRGENLIYCTPDNITRNKPTVLKAAAKLSVNLLYPMSGLQINEQVTLPLRIAGLLGEGQTAQVLRNLCLLVYETSPNSWEKIVQHMNHLFSVKLHPPVENPQGFIDLFYSQRGAKRKLDISLSGRGFQQTLLILSYLHLHEGSVLLIDEPDAHLEILRQKQIFILLRSVAEETRSQIVLTTHSEILIDEGLRNGNLTLLQGQVVENLATKKGVLDALKYYNTPHYLRARQCGHVLYLEGNTDRDILHALANRLNHPVAENLNYLVNVYFVKDNYPEPDIDSELERVEGGFGITPEKHFFALRKLVPELCGLVILDGDGKSREDTTSQISNVDCKRYYWRRYEIENYFITRNLLLDSIQNHYREYPLLGDSQNRAPEILDKLIQERIFDGKLDDFDVWKDAPPEAQRLVWEGKTASHKLSALAEEFYEKLADAIGVPVLYRKGRLYELIELVEPESIPEEVTEMLDRLQDLLENAGPQE